MRVRLEAGQLHRKHFGVGVNRPRVIGVQCTDLSSGAWHPRSAGSPSVPTVSHLSVRAVTTSHRRPACGDPGAPGRPAPLHTSCRRPRRPGGVCGNAPEHDGGQGQPLAILRKEPVFRSGHEHRRRRSKLRDCPRASAHAPQGALQAITAAHLPGLFSRRQQQTKLIEDTHSVEQTHAGHAMIAAAISQKRIRSNLFHQLREVVVAQRHHGERAQVALKTLIWMTSEGTTATAREEEHRTTMASLATSGEVDRWRQLQGRGRRVAASLGWRGHSTLGSAGTAQASPGRGIASR